MCTVSTVCLARRRNESCATTLTGDIAFISLLPTSHSFVGAITWYDTQLSNRTDLSDVQTAHNQCVRSPSEGESCCARDLVGCGNVQLT